MKKYVEVGDNPKSPLSKEILHTYWKSPWDGHNKLSDYVNSPNSHLISDLIVNTVKKLYSDKDDIIELGCGVGRNLYKLHINNFRNLNGVDINEDAVNLARNLYPDMKCNLIVSPIEDIVKNMENYDIIFTVALLAHIHKDNEWIFKYIYKKCSKYLILIEDECTYSWRHFPRDYKEIFEGYGMKQILCKICSEEDGLDERYYLRVFKK